jgi:transcriptional regulator with XRE-family HTH domain
MSYYPLGYIIKNRREELQLSQEDLADGICSVSTLSRIENGERMPSKNHYEMLMQRLGYSALSLDYFTDKQDFIIHELKFKIRHAYIEKEFGQCRRLLEKLTSLTGERSTIDTQFISLYDTLLNDNALSAAETLERLEAALRLTCPKYGKDFVPKVLSYEEIIILNNIAINYEAVGKRPRAIELLYAIKNYYDRQISSAEESLRTQPMILYNLSANLGMAGRYDECIAVCDEAISLARRTYRYAFYGKTLYNRAWSLLRRDHVGDREQARLSLKQAYSFAYSVDNTKLMDVFQGFYRENFSEEISV